MKDSRRKFTLDLNLNIILHIFIEQNVVKTGFYPHYFMGQNNQTTLGIVEYLKFFNISVFFYQYFYAEEVECNWSTVEFCGKKKFAFALVAILWKAQELRDIYTCSWLKIFPQKYFTFSPFCPGVKFRRQHWLFLLICLLVFVIILSIYLPIASRVDNIEVDLTWFSRNLKALRQLWPNAFKSNNDQSSISSRVDNIEVYKMTHLPDMNSTVSLSLSW